MRRGRDAAVLERRGLVNSKRSHTAREERGRCDGLLACDSRLHGKVAHRQRWRRRGCVVGSRCTAMQVAPKSRRTAKRRYEITLRITLLKGCQEALLADCHFRYFFIRFRLRTLPLERGQRHAQCCLEPLDVLQCLLDAGNIQRGGRRPHTPWPRTPRYRAPGRSSTTFFVTHRHSIL